LLEVLLVKVILSLPVLPHRMPSHPDDTGHYGIALIKEFEGFRKAPYKDSAGVMTIGYGTTRDRDNKPITINHPDITRKQAEKFLMRDVTDAERAVREHVSVPLCPFQFDALVSFVYNLGEGNFQKSSLLRILNSGDLETASEEFHKWVYAKGKIMPGLILRRSAEADLFNHDIRPEPLESST
jgi:lysozyme